MEIFYLLLIGIKSIKCDNDWIANDFPIPFIVFY